MSERKPYTYVLLRYRHDPVSGEFANVGVLLHEPKSHFLQLRARHTIGRLSAMFPGISVDGFRSGVRAIERGIKDVAKDAASLFGSTLDARTLGLRSLPTQDASFVWAAAGSGVTADATVELERLYDRFVARYDEKARSLRDDAAIWKPVREKLAQRRIDDRLEAVTIKSPLDDVRFDHAWKNGKWHCYQPLSFDLVHGESIRDKASRWAGQLLALQDADEEFKPFFLVGRPRGEGLTEDYERALGILKLAGDPEVVEEDDIDAFVDMIEKDMLAHPQPA